MEKIITLIFEGVAHGGPEAIFLILLGVIGLLIWDRISMVKALRENASLYRDDINKIIDKYQEGQINVIQALNEIKLILTKIEAKS